MKERRDQQAVIRITKTARARVDHYAKQAGKTRAAFLRDLLNEGWQKRYDNAPVIYGPSDWQPIETAPKDGTPLILAPHKMVGWWEFGDEEWTLLRIPLNEDRTIQDDWSKPIKLFYCLYANVANVEPTHWLPCPLFPAQVGRNPEGGDPQGLRAEHEHAVGSEADDAPPPSNPPIPTTKTAEDHSEDQP